jgi:type IV fimbrial biogenesis protein FimT
MAITSPNEVPLRTRRFPSFQLLLRGFTLIELMVVIAIVAILASLAVPSFISLIANANVSQAVNSFISDTRFARGEGMRRGKSVTMCRSADPTAATPSCSTGNGSAVGGWMEGWVIFLDENANGTFNSPADVVLRVQGPVSGIGDFYAVNSNSSNMVTTGNRIIFDGIGRAIGQQTRWMVHAPGSLKSDDNYTRTLCMNSVGRVRSQSGVPVC